MFKPAPKEDPIRHVLRDGLIRDIAMAMRSGSVRAALIQVYCGIDAMAHLSLPEGQEKATRKDFMAWVTKYLPMVKDGLLTAEDVYGARNGLVHTYTSLSEFVSTGKARQLGYINRHTERVLFDESKDPNFAIVNVEALVNEFAGACDAFLRDALADPARRPTLQRRLGDLLIQVPVE